MTPCKGGRCSKTLLSALNVYCFATAASFATPSVAGQMKDILTTAFGMMLFGDSNTSGQALAGFGAGLVGGMAYSYFSYCDMNKDSAACKVTALVALAITFTCAS